MNSEDNIPLKVVLDTNVYVSAFAYPQNPIFQIWRKAIRRQYKLLVSPAIINEVGNVLRSTFGWPSARVIGRLKLLASVARIVTPHVALNAIPDDPSDNRILECAVEGSAHLIVSGDRHLRRLRIYNDIPIVTPIDFLRTLGAA